MKRAGESLNDFEFAERTRSEKSESRAPEREPALRLEAKEGWCNFQLSPSLVSGFKPPHRDTEFHAAEGAE